MLNYIIEFFEFFIFQIKLSTKRNGGEVVKCELSGVRCCTYSSRTHASLFTQYKNNTAMFIWSGCSKHPVEYVECFVDYLYLSLLNLEYRSLEELKYIMFLG